MDAPCEIQGSIHVFRLVNNMCPGKWVHIIGCAFFVCYYVIQVIMWIHYNLYELEKVQSNICCIYLIFQILITEFDIL